MTTESLAALRQRARAELLLRSRARQRLRTELPLMDWPPWLVDGYQRPTHFAELVSALERSITQPVYATVEAPPRHGKTDTVLAGLAKIIHDRPGVRIGYTMATEPMAKAKTRTLKRIVRNRLGLKIRRDQGGAGDWATTTGCEVFASGVDGEFTSKGFDIIVVDDPFKNRKQAESPLYRQLVWEWFTSTVLTRLEPGGSIFVVHTRWHVDDLIGRIHDPVRLKRDENAQEYERIRYQALDEETGEPLWPERYNREQLLKIKAASELDWFSLYQQSPRRRGQAVFRGVHWYDIERLPREGFVEGAGLDFAYSKRTSADASVIVEGRASMGRIWITHVEKARMSADEWLTFLRDNRRQVNRGRWTFFGSGQEVGIADIANREPYLLAIDARHATTDKYLRAQPAANAWNRGEILVPKHAPWADDFLRIIWGFTGIGDKEDDEVDSLAGLIEALQMPVDDYQEHDEVAVV